MIQCRQLEVPAGKFWIHSYEGSSGHTAILIPGLMEPKAGLFYIWHDLARLLHKQDWTCALFDLAGQGDSSLPFSVQTWEQQILAVQAAYRSNHLVFIGRGCATSLIPSDQQAFVIGPSPDRTLLDLLPHIRMQPSPFNGNCMTPADPQSLTEEETRFWHGLGAEAACLGGLELPNSFFDDLKRILPAELPKTWSLYHKPAQHPLLDKERERQALFHCLLDSLQLERKGGISPLFYNSPERPPALHEFVKARL